MSVALTSYEIEYPESDGKPVGETDVHIDWIFRLRDMLRYRYAGQRVYVGSDMLVYYQEGKPNKFFVPDEFVVLDCEQRDRRTFKIWEEKRTPNVIFEVTSLSSKREDLKYKPKSYAKIGVGEYFLYDPTAEYLRPALQGFRLREQRYMPIESDADGWLACEQLGIELRLDARDLVLRDATTQKVLLTRADAEQAAREAEQARRKAEQARRKAEQARREVEQARREVEQAAREAERAAREAAEAKVAELQSELQRLRDELESREG